jgi:hypothetical protein
MGASGGRRISDLRRLAEEVGDMHGSARACRDSRPMVTCFLGVGRAFRIVASLELIGWAGVVESRSQCPLQAPCGDYVPPAEEARPLPDRPLFRNWLAGRVGSQRVPGLRPTHGRGTAPTIRWGGPARGGGKFRRGRTCTEAWPYVRAAGEAPPLRDGRLRRRAALSGSRDFVPPAEETCRYGGAGGQEGAR